MSRWGWRAKKVALRRKLLGRLLPEHRDRLNWPGHTPLIIVVPMPTGLLSAKDDSDRAAVCAYAGRETAVQASLATRKRVGSSATTVTSKTPEDVFRRARWDTVGRA